MNSARRVDRSIPSALVVWFLIGVSFVSFVTVGDRSIWERDDLLLSWVLLLGGAHLVVGTVGGAIAGFLRGRERIGRGALFAILLMYLYYTVATVASLCIAGRDGLLLVLGTPVVWFALAVITIVVAIRFGAVDAGSRSQRIYDEEASMADGAPGDHPLTDVLIHGLDVYDEETDDLICRISELCSRRELVEWWEREVDWSADNQRARSKAEAEYDRLVVRAREGGWDLSDEVRNALE